MSLKFSCLTALPSLLSGALGGVEDVGVFGRALKQGLVEVEIVNLRDFSLNARKDIDGRAVSGADGMILLPEVCQAALNKVRTSDSWVVHLSPCGKVFNNAAAKKLAHKQHIVLLCGRYAGFDQRFLDQNVDEEISLGDFVLSGGELPAACVIDTVARFIPGVLGNVQSAGNDSFEDGLLEPPQYTKPLLWQELPVPAELLSGDHKKIESFRRKQQIIITAKNRPDLLFLAWDTLTRAERSLAERIWRKG